MLEMYFLIFKMLA